MTGKFASKTTVPVQVSRAEVEVLLEKYGADEFAYGTEAGKAQIGFRIRGVLVRLEIPMPLRDDPAYRLTRTGRIAAATVAQQAWEQDCRQRWRALVLVIKAKLEAAEIGITTIEREFLSDTILPDGRTVATALLPQIAASYQTGAQPPLLASGH